MAALRFWLTRVSPDIRWAVLVMALVGTLGGLATDVGPWYRALHQPDWKPPDWAFGPIWTGLYVLTGWAGVRTWRRMHDLRQKRIFLIACGLNGALNVLWSVLYFSARRPDWALIEGALLWFSAVGVMSLMARVDRGAAALMVPHLLWLALAWALNLSTLHLNPGMVGT